MNSVVFDRPRGRCTLIVPLFLLLLLGVILGGCARRGGPLAYDPPNFGAPTLTTTGTIPQGLPVGPFDRLQITIFRVPDLTGEYVVTADGNVDMPLIGSITASNRTPTELGEELERSYAVRYLRNPRITVRVIETTQNRFTVEGGVNVPGVYSISGKTTLMTALAAARGIHPEYGNPRRVAILRKIDGRQMGAAFDVISIRRGEMANPDVYPGDVVVVDSDKLRTIYREILSFLPVAGLFNAIGQP